MADILESDPKNPYRLIFTCKWSLEAKGFKWQISCFS